MRSVVRHALSLGVLGLAVVGWSGCEAKQATEYVTGISTQVSVPRDLKAVRVQVNVGGFPQFCRPYRVYDGKVQLPRSLGTFPNSDSAISQSGPVTYTIVGITEDYIEGSQNPHFALCDGAAIKIGQDNARILRRSRQPYIKDEILFLPMPLKYSCYDVDCGTDDGLTCKGGKCVSATLNEDQAKALPKYSPELSDGTGSTCFSLNLCMSAALAAVPVNPVDCTYAIPGTKGMPPTLPNVPSPFPKNCGPGESPPNVQCVPNAGGANVEVVYDGGLNSEILDFDMEEGFWLPPDAGGEQRFRLAPGLCEMVKGIDDKGQPTKHRISAIRASAQCRPKVGTQPLCAADQLKQMGLDGNGVEQNPKPPASCKTIELTPPKSMLNVVIDDTTGHQALFAAFNKTEVDVNDEDTLVEPAVRNALNDPAFRRTDIGLAFSPGSTDACSPTLALDIAPKVSTEVSGPLRELLKGRVNSLRPGTPKLAGAMERALKSLNDNTDPQYFRKAMLVIGNRNFLEDDGCGKTPKNVAEEALSQGIKTYVAQLTKQPAKDGASDELAIAGGGKDASIGAKDAARKFQEIVDDLATCVYDVPDDKDAPLAGDVISFTNPLTYPAPGSTVRIEFSANGCTSEKTGDGNQWSFDPNPPAGKKRIYLCKGDDGNIGTPAGATKGCAAYRHVLRQVTQFTAIHQQPPLPVPLFAYKAQCQ